MLEKNKEYPLIEIIKYAKNIIKNYGNKYYDYTNFYLYSKDQNIDYLILDNNYFYADYPEVTKDGEEIYPSIVRKNKLVVAYTGESFMDVINLAFEQKNNASYEEYVKALNYYYDNDEFIDLL